MNALSIEDQIAYAWSSRRRVRSRHSKEHIHIARYIRPELAEFFEETRTLDRPAIEMLWDDTAIKANEMWARGLWSLAHNSSTEWFFYQDKNKAVMQDAETQAWYQMVNTDLKEELAASGAYVALLTRLMDVGGFGFGALYSYEDNERPDSITYEWVPASECFYTVGRNGLANSFIRPLNLTAREAHLERGWPFEKMDPTVKTAFDNHDESVRFLFLHVVWERKERPRDRAPRNNQEYKWAGYYYQPQGRKIINEHGYRDFPYHVLGWMTQANIPYPVGIGYRTLPEIRNLNSDRKTFARILGNEADSPILATNQDEHERGQRRPEPGEFLYGGISGDGRRLMDPLYAGPNGSRTMAPEIQTSRMLIQESWYYSLFMMQTQHQMTAQEVRSRDAKLVQAMGPFLILMSADIKTIIDRMFYTRLEAGVYDPLPAVFGPDTQMELKFSGLLAKALETMEGEQIVSLLAEGQLIAQYEPNAVLLGTDFNAAWRHLANSKSIPRDIVLSAEQYKKRVEENAAREQAMQAAAMAPQLAAAAKDGAAAMQDMSNAPVG